MSFWQFLDGQLRRLTFRIAVGWFALIAGVGALVALSFVPVPEDNKALIFGQIGVLIGWGGAVVASQFGDRRPGNADPGNDAGQGRSG